MKTSVLTSIAMSLGAVCSLYAKPEDLDFTRFAGPDVVPSPACMAVSAEGDVYVGVDLLGSLDKGPNKGRIVKLNDTNNDGKADAHSIFAEIDNPRGIIAMGDQLYVLHADFAGEKEMQGMYLSVLEDKDKDGKADGPPRHLIKNISTLKFNRSRGADHTTNGIRMGIDGWIYIAVGDFGFVDAEGTDGTKMTLLGGGVIRVRPDGSDMELYTYGMRNIYDVAIDPFMNIFTRGNTNDGVGWWIRFADHIQTGDYGYPSLYMYFTDEIIPSLCDLGRGSGSGALYLDEPTWVNTAYNKQALMADWGRNHVYMHSVTADGPTFTQVDKEFIQISQPTDIDVDGSGRLYISAWAGAGYKGNPKRGYVERAVPQGWTLKEFPDLKKLDAEGMLEQLGSSSAKARLAAQQEILSREGEVPSKPIFAIAKDESELLEGRVAALYTYAQLTGEAGVDSILSLLNDKEMREHALRAATDIREIAKNVPTAPYVKALSDPNPRVVVAALIGLARIGDVSVAPEVVKLAKTESRKFQVQPKDMKKREKGSHAEPNAQIIIPHIAVQTLREFKAVAAALAALDSPAQDGAIWALRRMHEPKAVDGLIAKLESTTDEKLKIKLMDALARLYSMESPYKGDVWWQTKPNPHGPYYWETTWEESEKIAKVYHNEVAKASAELKELYLSIAEVNKAYIPDVVEAPQKVVTKGKRVGDIAIEDVMIALDKKKSNLVNGKKILSTQACIGCHSIEEGQRKLGPDLNKIGAVLDKEAIADAILKADATIAENWVNATMKDGTVHNGTLVSKDDSSVIIRNIAGVETQLTAADVKVVKKADSTIMMSNLLNALTLQEFVDVVAYLASKK
jgi:putative heme-binding domain-containing protein